MFLLLLAYFLLIIVHDLVIFRWIFLFFPTIIIVLILFYDLRLLLFYLFFHNNILHCNFLFFALWRFLIDHLSIGGLFFLFFELLWMHITCFCRLQLWSFFSYCFIIINALFYFFFLFLLLRRWNFRWYLGYLLLKRLLCLHLCLSDLKFKVSCIEIVKHGLVFHQLNLKVLICFIMIGYQVVYSFKERSQAFAVVFLLQQKFLFWKDLNQINQAITSLSGEFLGVRSNIWKNSDDWLVNRPQKSRSILDKFWDWNENKVRVGPFKFWDVKFNS